MYVYGHRTGRKVRQTIDWWLVACYLALVFIGLINIYASVHSAEPSSIFDWSVRSGKQFVWLLTAFALAAIIIFVVSPRLWESPLTPILYCVVLFLLVAVIFLGVEVKGSRSWFEFGPVRFQPAEISKITTSLLLAYILSRDGVRLNSARGLLIAFTIIALPMLFILSESETGSALVYMGFLFVLYREGFSGWWLAVIGLVILLFILTLVASSYTSILVLIALLSLVNFMVHEVFPWWFVIMLPTIVFLGFFPWLWGLIPTDFAGGMFASVKPVYILIVLSFAAAIYFLYKAYRLRSSFLFVSLAVLLLGIALVYSTEFIFTNVLQEHQRLRIEVLLGLRQDPAGVGYNVHQSMIAIGSGGFFGKGFLNGTQTTYGFVPEQSTDFIFCTVGEEWGFVGCAIVILLYVFMIWRLVMDAEESRENFTRIYGYCAASCIFMHLVINIGMTIGIMPVIGIPLPFLSYGGSSLWGFTILISIFIALYREEKKYF